MVQKIQKPDYSRREFQLTPFIDFEEVDDRNLKAISHLLGWNDSKKKWIMVRVDSEGKLMTTAPGIATKHVIKKISATDTEGSTGLTEPYNTHVIYNDGPNDVYVEFDTTATTDSFKIPAKASLSLDLEFQVLHYICASGETATLYWLALK